MPGIVAVTVSEEPDPEFVGVVAALALSEKGAFLLGDAVHAFYRERRKNHKIPATLGRMLTIHGMNDIHSRHE